jgi:recombination protein RecA
MSSASEERDVSLKNAVESIRKKHGETVLMRVGDEQSRAEVDVVPTGCMSLNAALGVGGIPRGRIVEIFGPEASGKTTLALHLIAEAQKLGGHAALVDLEYAFPLEYARTLGVDVDELWVSQPDSGEQALDIVEQLVRSNAVDVVVIDSVAALVPRAELEGEMGDAHVGLQARLMSQALRKLTGVISRTKSIVVFINQIRMKIGVMFGNPETTPGGNALKFYSSVRLDIRRIATIKEGDNAVGNRVRVKVVKNKVAPPFRQAEFDIVYGEGISALGDMLDLGAARKIVEKSGTWYSFGDERLGQGRVNAVKFLKENAELARNLEDALRTELGIRAPARPPQEEAAE